MLTVGELEVLGSSSGSAPSGVLPRPRLTAIATATSSTSTTATSIASRSQLRPGTCSRVSVSSSDGRETAAARADVVEGPVLVTAGHHRPGVRARVARLAGLLGEQRALRRLLERRWRGRRLVAGAQPGDLVVLVVEDRQAGLGGSLHDRGPARALARARGPAPRARSAAPSRPGAAGPGSRARRGARPSRSSPGCPPRSPGPARSGRRRSRPGSSGCRGRWRGRGRPASRLAARVEQLVAQVVQAAGYAGPHLPGPEHPAVLLGRTRYAGRRDPGPPAGQGRVQQTGQVDHVTLRVARRQAVQRRVDAEADDPDRAVVVEQHVLRREQAVGDAVRVRGGDRVGHLADHPRPTPR